MSPARRVAFPEVVSASLIAVALALALPAVASADFTLTIGTAGSGLGTVECEVEGGGPEECAEEYPEGTELTLAPIAEAGSTLAGFSAGSGSAAGCTGTSPCTFTIAANSSVTATFDLEEFTLTIEEKGAGSGTVECEAGKGFGPCAAKYPAGTELSLFAEPDPGSEFVRWSGACSDAEEFEECELTIEGNTTVKATFSLEPMSALAVHIRGKGTGTVECEAQEGPEPCVEKYPEGTELTLLAEAGPNSEFAGWSGECDRIVGNECEVEMDEAHSVTATFDLIPHQLSVTKNGTGKGTVRSSPTGISCGATCSASFGQGTTVTLSGAPGANTQAVQWSGCDSVNAEGKCVVAIDAAKSVTATFDQVPPPATPPPATVLPPPPIGEANVAGIARVKGGTALARVSCRGSGPCEGALKLVAKLKGGRGTVIGSASFSLPSGASETLRVRLRRRARQLLKGGRTLKAGVSGSGIEPRTVKLISP